MLTNTDFLSPIETNEFLPPITRWITWGGLFIFCILGFAIPVAGISKYKETVKAQVVVRPAGELRIVQAATEGQVTQIYVKENQVVKKGEAIASIGDSRLQTKKRQLQTNTQQAKLQLVQINAQIQSINSQIRAENDKLNRIITGAEAELKGRRREHEDKKITTISEVQEADANIKIAQEELQAGVAQLKTAQANVHAAEAGLGAAMSKQSRYEAVASEGALSKNQLEEAQLSVKQQQQSVEAAKATVEVQEQTIKRLQQSISAAIARRQRVETALNPSDAAVEIVTQRIAQEKAAGESNKVILLKEGQALVKQRIDIDKQLERDISELKQVEIDLTQTTITATEDGIITQLNLRNQSQTLRAGEEVVQIVPSNAQQVVKGVVASEEKNKLKIGQKVQIRVSACPYPDYGTLNGKLQSISPDAMTPQRNGTNTSPTSNTTPKAAIPGAYYEVIIEPETLVLGKGKGKDKGKDKDKNLCHIQLGMEGRADIISREETVLQFFLRKARLTANF
jgi:multidrug efflux pump subunit AcrA (membrane-fusion protein)